MTAPDRDSQRSWAMWFVSAEAACRVIAVTFAWMSLLDAAPVSLVVILTTLWFGCLAFAQVLAGDVVTVVEASDTTHADVLLRAWTADRISVEADAVHTVLVDDLVSLSFDRKPVPFAGGESLVLLSNGDRLVVRPVGVFDDVLTATWHRFPGRPPLKLPLETVSAIVFDLPSAKSDRLRLFADLQTLPAGDDIVLLANGDRIQGEFERLDGAFLQLKGAGGISKIDRNRVRAIRMNPELTSNPRIAGRRLMLSMTDGSRFTALRAERFDQDVKFATHSKLEFALPLADVASCRVYGTRVIPLSERAPTDVAFTPYLSAPWSLIKNANVLRGPLSLRGIEFGSGLGMHSRMAATFELRETDREFRAVIGIDDCANGGGSARFAIELDGKPAWSSEELTGRSPALVVPPLKLNGAKNLTLLVDFGQNADVADYADWCDAVLIVDRPEP
jgi:NPCBM/NEW2 domain